MLMSEKVPLCCRQPFCCFSVDNMMIEGMFLRGGEEGEREIRHWLSKALLMKIPSYCQQDWKKIHTSTEAHTWWSSPGAFIYYHSFHCAQYVLPAFRCSVYLLLFSSISFIFSFPACFLTTSALCGDKLGWCRTEASCNTCLEMLLFHT